MNADYKSCFRQLNEENKKLVRKIRLYLEGRYLNEVAQSELLGDIAGMALECQKRGESFRDAIGNDYESFCKELVRNSPRRSVAEGAFLILFWILAVMGAIVPVLWLWGVIAPALGLQSLVMIDTTILQAPSTYVLKYLIFSVLAVCGWFFAFRLSYKSRTGVLAVYLTILFLGFFVFNLFTNWIVDPYVWRISVPVWILVFLILVGFSLVAKRLVALTVAYQRRRKEEKEKTTVERGTK